jgi:hypothetical protein
MVMPRDFREQSVTHDKAHERPADLDPKVNGPFLDDIREEQERSYRETRNVNSVKGDE